MAMDDFLKPITQKAFEVSYAVFRVANTLNNRDLASFLERRALEVTDAVMVKEYDRAVLALGALEYLLRLGAEAGLVNHQTAQIIISEASWLNAAIAGLDKSVVLPNVDLREIFSKISTDSLIGISALGVKEDNKNEELLVPDKVNEMTAEARSVSRSVGKLLGEMEPAITGNPAIQVSGPIMEARQTMILNKVKQRGYCQLKDLQEILPQVSERTIRYDLQRLNGQGLVERIGNGGPATFYRIKREVA